MTQPNHKFIPAQCNAWLLWVASRPPAIQVLAMKYPIGTKFNCHGKTLHTVGYGESEAGATVQVSPVDPFENYEQAVAQRVNVCSCCVPKLEALVIP